MEVRMSRRNNSLNAKVRFGLFDQIIFIPEKLQKAIFSHLPHQVYILETAGQEYFILRSKRIN